MRDGASTSKGQVLTCRFCGRLCKSQGGLTRHENVCPQRQEQAAPAPLPAEQEPAFMMWPNHLPILLDVDFAVTLSGFILDRCRGESKPDPRIYALARQLQPL